MIYKIIGKIVIWGIKILLKKHNIEIGKGDVGYSAETIIGYLEGK